jgi:hypothetical protein
MLRECIEKCPQSVWDDVAHKNTYWQIAYHALYFTHLYLQPRSDDFVPWSEHQSDVQNPDGLAGPTDPNSSLPLIPEPYTKAQVLAYCLFCDGMVDTAVDALDLGLEDSGFHWYPIPKLEHQLVNIRHLQHHVAQLADRLRNEADVGINWVGMRRTPG